MESGTDSAVCLGTAAPTAPFCPAANPFDSAATARGQTEAGGRVVWSGGSCSDVQFAANYLTASQMAQNELYDDNGDNVVIAFMLRHAGEDCCPGFTCTWHPSQSTWMEGCPGWRDTPGGDEGGGGDASGDQIHAA